MCAAVAGERGRRVLLLETQCAAGTEDPDLWWRAVQFYESALRATEFHLGKQTFCQIGGWRFTSRDTLLSSWSGMDQVA